MKKYIFYTFLMFLTSISVFGQSQACFNFNRNSNAEQITNNNCIKITENITLSDVTLQGTTVIEVPAGVTFKISNNFNTGNATNITFNVYGKLVFGNVLNAEKSIVFNIYQKGELSAGDQGTVNMNLKGPNNQINNQGKISIGVLGFERSTQNTMITNHGEMYINGNININAGITTFQNAGKLIISQNYSNNSTSTYINCGTMQSGSGFNLGGGRVENTGTFTVTRGSVNLNNNATFINKGLVEISNTIEGGGFFTNEGRVVVNEFKDLKEFRGPADSSKKGFVYVVNKTNANQMKIGPNLEFRKVSSLTNLSSYTQNADYSSIFNGVPTYINAAGNVVTQSVANVTYGCASCSSLESYTNLACSFIPLRVNTCTKPANTIGEGLPSVSGISTLVNEKQDWPQHVSNGQLVLSSASKGLVLTRTTSDLIAEPVVGMLIYDTASKCIKMYSSRGWNCLTKSCNTL